MENDLDHPNPTHGQVPFLCMKCGEVHTRLVRSVDDAAKKTAACKKCGRDARMFSITTFLPILQTVIKQQERIEARIFDLEAAEQERAEPGVESA